MEDNRNSEIDNMKSAADSEAGINETGSNEVGINETGIKANEATVQKKAGTAAATAEGSFIKDLIIDILIAIILAGAVLFFIRPTVVKQSSMENTFMENDYLIMYNRAYKHDTPQRGDVVVFQSSLVNYENGRNKLLIKRVIGLPGDEISIINQQLYINGEKYEEDYLKDGITPAMEIPQEGETFTVPDGEYYVMGDNRAVSVDSRYSEVGCITVDQIKGKVVLRLFPLKKLQSFK